MQKVTPFLWFDANAEDAANFYLSVFRNSRKLDELRPNNADGSKGSLLVIDLEIEGQQVTFLNGGPAQKLSEAFSFTVRCDTQSEIDGYWSKLGNGGKELACGWLKDKFGVCWQIIPSKLVGWLKHPAAMRAMLKMTKLDIATLESAAAEAE